MEDAILAIDCGTSGTKSALITSEMTFMPLGTIPRREVPPSSPDTREWIPKEAVGDLGLCLFRAQAKASREKLCIQGIGLTSTSSSLVTVQGHWPLDVPPALQWDDRQSREEASELKKWRKATGAFPWGSPAQPDSGLAKALFLTKHHADLLVKPDIRVMEQWTFLNHWLTGRTALTETILSRKWGVTRDRPWNAAFVALLRRKLRKYTAHMIQGDPLQWFKQKMTIESPVTAGQRIGKIRATVAKITGLPLDTPVFAVPYDTCAQVMGLGLVKPSDFVGLSLGTSLGLCAVVPERPGTKWGPLGPIPAVPLPGMQMLFDGVASCGAAIRYICARFGIWADNKPDFAQIEDALGSTQPGARGVTMLPYFSGGRRTSIAKPSLGLIDNLDASVGNKEIIRALFESLAYLTRLILEDFESEIGQRFLFLRAGGGLTRNTEFLKIISAITGRPVEVYLADRKSGHNCPREDLSSPRDTALLGAAVCVAAGLKWCDTLSEAADALMSNLKSQQIRPNREWAQRHNDLYRRYTEQYGEKIKI